MVSSSSLVHTTHLVYEKYLRTLVGMKLSQLLSVHTLSYHQVLLTMLTLSLPFHAFVPYVLKVLHSLHLNIHTIKNQLPC
jgi:hypothetical protein